VRVAVSAPTTGGSANTVADFIATGGGTVAGTVPTAVISSGGFLQTSLFVITGSTSGATIGGTVSHDDGASLYQGANTIFDSSPRQSRPQAPTRV
jgi:hypothetical protein